MTKSELRQQLKQLREQMNNCSQLNEIAELAKQIQITCEEIMKVPAPKLIETFQTRTYTIEMYSKVNDQDWQLWELKFINNNTGKLDEILSDTNYLSESAAIKEVKKFQQLKSYKKVGA